MSDSTKPAKPKSTKPKAPPSHPKYTEMIASAIKSLNQKGGSSKAAIMKYITANYKVGDNSPRINGNIKYALRQGVLKHTFAQTKGVGASGSFKLRKAEKSKVEKKQKKVKKPAKVGKKPATKKPKTVKSKKSSTKSVKPAKSRVTKPKKAIAKKATKKPIKKPTTKKASKK